MFSSSPAKPAFLPLSTPQSEVASIPFTLTHTRESYRLLELPSDLLQLLESEEPPVLHLRSSVWKLLPSGLYTRAPGQLHVCGREKAWSVRQVSTSNEVKICRPSPTKDGEDEVAISAIANCDSVLELSPANVDLSWFIEQDLKAMSLASFEEQIANMSRKHDISIDRNRRTDPFVDFPAPDAVIEQTLRQLCVFQTPGTNELCRPDSDLLLEAWRQIYDHYRQTLDQARNNDISLSKQDFLAFECKSGIEAQAWRSLGLAIFNLARTNGADNAAVDPDKTLEFVAKILLQTTAPGTDLETFQEQCQDNLPQAWASRAALEKLQGQIYEVCERDGKKLVRSCTVAAQGQGEVDAKKVKLAGGGKRKWHEKLGESRVGR